MTSVGDHVRPTTATHDPGVYRVVGTGETVTLLRITDGAERRVSVGELTRVSRTELESMFTLAENPDAGFSPLRALRSALVGLYWNVRKRV